MTAVELDENLGVSGGRNVAWQRLRDFGDVDVVIDLDDDGLLVDADVFRTVRDLYADDPRLGIVSFRIADETGETQRRHVPRLRASDPMRGGEVTTFLGGGHALSVPMLERIGGWPDEFFFTHEETDLAWRALDAGWKVLYAPELLLQHPRTSPARHAVYYRMTARNRVWLARRHLPLPAGPRLPRYVDPPHPRPHPRPRRAAGLGGRLPGGRSHPVRHAAAHAVAHGVADDAGWAVRR